jgi:aspartate/methionine/tyrosine aminotransferase
LRCGWILAEPKLAEKIWSLNDLVANIPPHAAELLSCAALEQLDQIRERARTILHTNHQLFNSFLAERSDLSAPSFSHGTVSFPKLLHGDVEQLLRILRDKHDTSVVPGKFFGLKDHFRVGLGGEIDNFAEGVQRLSLALDQLKISE